jgi:hypothetical protein
MQRPKLKSATSGGASAAGWLSVAIKRSSASIVFLQPFTDVPQFIDACHRPILRFFSRHNSSVSHRPKH